MDENGAAVANGKGQRTLLIDISGNTKWLYDGRGRVTQEQKVISGTGGGTFMTQWGYDAADRPVWQKYPGGSYGTHTTRSYVYNNAGSITSFEGTAFYYQDTAHKHAVTHVEGTAAGNQKYWYDANGNSTRRINGSSDITIIYDGENRLTGMSGAVSARYVYDGDPLRFAAGLCGNRVKETLSGVTRVFVGNHYEVDNGVVKK